MSSSSSNNTNNSENRRPGLIDNVDDIFQQICSKMSSLSTGGSENKQDMVSAFVSVLVCSEMEASFFLESAGWDIANVIL